MKLKITYILCLALLCGKLTGELRACEPQINWGAYISFCQGNSFTLSAFNPNSSYQWSTGASSSAITINQSGTYWVTVTNNCGSTSDTIQVVVNQPVNINLGADRKICSTTPTVLRVPNQSYTSYLWSTGAIGDSIVVSQSGTYYVEASNACGTFTDTVALTAENPPAVSLGPDVIQCNSQPVTFNLSPNITGSILWDDGSTGSSRSVNADGQYWVMVLNSCGVYSDTVQVNYLLNGQVLPSDSLSLCVGGSMSLQSPVQANSYLWSTGSTTPGIQITQAGTYWLRITSSCGTVYDTVHIKDAPKATVILGPDQVICASSPVTLDAGNSGSRYTWSNGSKSRTINVSATGSYWVGVNNGCGYVYDTVNITADPVPNPNLSDTLYVCQGKTTEVLDAGNWGSQTNYLWSNGSTSRLGGTFSPGSHWVTVSNVCDTVTTNFFVKGVSTPAPNLGNDTVLCANALWINANLNPHEYQFYWSDGSSGTRIRVRNTGLYWLQAANACDTVTDSIFVKLKPHPSGIAEDTVVKCGGTSYNLTSSLRRSTSYLWNTGDTAHQISIVNPGTYWVSVSNSCGSITDTVHVFDTQPLAFDLGNDTLICKPHWLNFNLAYLQADSVIWRNQNHSNSYRVTSSGYHWATAYNACGSFTDSIYVSVRKKPQKQLRDTSYCNNSAVMLSSSQGGNCTYAWNTGDTTASILVNTTGWYYVDITNYCGTIRDSAHVKADYNLSGVNLGPDTVFCAGSITLDPGSILGAYYQWQNGDTSRTLTVTKSGTYYVRVYNTCNSVYDTINVSITGPPSLTLGNNVRFCKGSFLNLYAQNPGCSYLWSTGDTSQSISVSEAGSYWVQITNDCGSVTDSVDVIVEAPLDSLDLGNDTLICRGDSLLLETKVPGVHTKWQNGSATHSIYVKESGTYWVEVSNTCGTWDDTIVVQVQDPPSFSLGEDTVICGDGGSISLQGPANMVSYQWSTGASDREINVTQAGTYWLTLSNECFSSTDTVEITEDQPLELNLGADTLLCHGESIILEPELAGASYYWNDHWDLPRKEITRPGTYWIVARNACGIFSDTVNVSFAHHYEPLPEEKTICDGDTAVFDLRQLNKAFSWFDGSTEKLREFTEEGVYPIYISNRCGEFRKDYHVNISHCECPFFVPNAFTPNEDGVNDEFKLGHSCDLTRFSMQIFNRWGSLVFQSSEAETGWDGRYQGEPLAPGIYTYSVTYEWYVYDEKHVKSETGTLSLMR